MNNNPEIPIMQPVPLQIKIGVTGHRNIVHAEELKSRIRKALTESVQKIINSKNRKIITPFFYKVVTPLADGADRILANQAMDALNAEIEAVIPMKPDYYEATFLSENSKIEFRELLLLAKHDSIVLDNSSFENLDAGELAAKRDQAYKRAGEYVVDNCDILIALWNGKETDDICGTYPTIQYAAAKKKYIIIIPTDLQKDNYIELGERNFEEELDRFEFFNRFKISEIEYKRSYSDNCFEFLNNSIIEKLDRENVETVKNILIPIYTKTSLIAGKFQNLYKRTGSAAYLLSPLAVVAVACAIYYKEYANLFYALEFIILSTIIIAIKYADRKRANRKWVYHRYLSEQFRSAIYLTLAGEKPETIKIDPHLRVAHKPDEWLVKLHNQVIENLDVVKYRDDELEKLKGFVKEEWLQKQIDYHKKTSNKLSKHNRNFEKYGLIVFGIALFLSFSHIISSMIGAEEKLNLLFEIIPFIAISLPAFGASIGAIRNHREFARLSRRSDNMCHTLEHLKKECDDVKSMQELRFWLKKIEKTMLHESQDWLMLMKFVKLEAI